MDVTMALSERRTEHRTAGAGRRRSASDRDPGAAMTRSRYDLESATARRKKTGDGGHYDPHDRSVLLAFKTKHDLQRKLKQQILRKQKIPRQQSVLDGLYFKCISTLNGERLPVVLGSINDRPPLTTSGSAFL
jgi:hypothetical protein